MCQDEKTNERQYQTFPLAYVVTSQLVYAYILRLKKAHRKKTPGAFVCFEKV